MHNLQGKRVLVTGAAGFIGSNLIRVLLRHEVQVHALVKPSTALWRIAELAPRIHLHSADLTDRAELQGIVRRIEPQIVFHLAFPGGHPSQPESRIEFLQTSVQGTANLLEASAPIAIERFVHFGSSLEYGPRNTSLTESDRLEPLTFRGVAKAAATLLCQQYARANNYPIVVLRPFSVYGYWEAPTRLVPTAILAVLRNQAINLTIPDFRHDMIFVEDVVEAGLLALEAALAAGEIINIGSGQQFSNDEIVSMVQEISGQKIKVHVGVYPPSPSDTSNWVADIRKAKTLLGWEPRHTLVCGLEKTMAWFREHQDVYNVR